MGRHAGRLLPVLGAAVGALALGGCVDMFTDNPPGGAARFRGVTTAGAPGFPECAPMALDVDTLRALEDALLDFAGCAVIISHDRWFLDRIATHVLAFEGDSKTVWCEGNYQTYEAQKRQRLGEEADQPHRIRYKPLKAA